METKSSKYELNYAKISRKVSFFMFGGSGKKIENLTQSPHTTKSNHWIKEIRRLTTVAKLLNVPRTKHLKTYKNNL